jgi:class 3 adenylate cyclase
MEQSSEILHDEVAQHREDIARLIHEVDALVRERSHLQNDIHRLEKRASHAEDVTNVLKQCSTFMNPTLTIADVLRRVLYCAVDFMQAERGFIALRNEQGDLTVRVAYSMEHATDEAEKPLQRSIMERTLLTGVPDITTDMESDPQQMRSIVCAPLKMRSNSIGVIYLDSRLTPSSGRMGDPDLLEAYMNLATPAIESARNLHREQIRARTSVDHEATQTRLLAAIADGILSIDAQDRISLANENAERFLDIEPGALLNTPVGALEAHLPGICRLLAQARTSNLSIRRTLSDSPLRGGRHVVDVELVPLRDGVVLVTLNDVSGTHRLEETMERYFAPKVVRNLLSNPSEPRPSCERLRATLMFAEIRGMNEQAVLMKPGAAIALLNQYLERAAEVIFEHEGMIDGFHGEGMVAVFGAPRPCNDDAERALNAAVALMSAWNKVGAEFGSPLGISIGLASGTVISGHVGHSTRTEYTVVGEAVNLAERLEAKAEAGSILCDGPTYEAAGLDLAAESFAASLRGRPDGFTIYRIRPEA